jgi:hypothetical protein
MSHFTDERTDHRHAKFKSLASGHTESKGQIQIQVTCLQVLLLISLMYSDSCQYVFFKLCQLMRLSSLCIFSLYINTHLKKILFYAKYRQDCVCSDSPGKVRKTLSQKLAGYGGSCLLFQLLERQR